jgi:AAA15 family ATPase/GTPase
VPEGIEVMRGFPEGKGLEEKTRDNALFLSVADQFNGPVSAQIMAWFRDFNIISGLGHNNYRRLIYSMLEHPSTASMLNDFFRSIDLGFEEIRLEKRDLTPEELSGEIPENMINNLVSETGTRRLVSLRSTHRVFNDEQQITGEAQFDVRRRESSGTNKIVDLSGPVFDTLLSGGVLGVDELDASLHPLLTLSLVKLFQNPEINKKGAQLIFSTHDTNLLSICELRRDQIYFVEKDRAGASDLYSLVEYDRDGKVRKDRSFEKDYINGRYGAIPYFGEFDKLMY